MEPRGALAAGLDRLLAIDPGEGALRALLVALAESVPDAEGAVLALERGGVLEVVASAGVAAGAAPPALALRAITRRRVALGRPPGPPFPPTAAAAAAAPLRQARGALVLATRTRRALDGTAVALVRLAADRVDLALAAERAARGTPEEEGRRRAVDFILGVVGHDLRNPLGAISMSAALLHGRGGLGGWQARAVERMRSSAGRMGRIIADLLSYTRARLGAGLPVNPRDADLRAIVSRVADELASVNADRRIEVEVEGDPHGRWDPDRLEQVASNLLANALEHGEPGTPVFVRIADRGAHVTLEVRNAGALPPGLAEQLFEPFTRPPDAVSRKASGLGLGLFIAREIVRAHGGEIGARAGGDEVAVTVRLPREA